MKFKLLLLLRYKVHTYQNFLPGRYRKKVLSEDLLIPADPYSYTKRLFCNRSPESNKEVLLSLSLFPQVIPAEVAVLE